MLQTLVLDEADRMLDLGFERDLDILLAALPKKRMLRQRLLRPARQ